MMKEERNKAAAKAIREAAEGVPETLAWVLYECADRVEDTGLDYAAKTSISTVSFQFKARDQGAWQTSKILLLVNLIAVVSLDAAG